MKDMGVVRGSAAQSKALIVGVDTVYVHKDIIQVNEDADGNSVEGLFEYHEIQYRKDEYIKRMDEKNVMLEKQLTDTQLALVEIYESMGV